MFTDEDLLKHLKTSNTLEIKSLVVAEWNMNDLDNIFKYGNYRYRPFGAASAQFTNLLSFFDKDDFGDFYTDADLSTNLSIEAQEDDGTPIRFTSVDQDRKFYFNLLQCFEPFRPRSGINKVIWNKGKYIDNVRSGQRPRYYLASRNDTFKYWNSYRRATAGEGEEGIFSAVMLDYGMSFPIDETETRGFDIYDVAPFVVYNEAVPANRIVVKMQTNLAAEEGSTVTIRNENGEVITDPLKDRSKSSVPKRWGIQYLDQDNNWITASEFNEDSLKSDGTPIVDWDGHVELYYGLKVPTKYKKDFHLVDYITSLNVLPDFENVFGESYLFGATSASAGTVYTWDGQTWDTYPAEYGFSLYEQNDTQKLGVINKLTNPKNFTNNEKTVYRDISYIKGLRVFVKTMNAPNQTFDLIEMSPRLKVDLTDYVLSFDVTKEIANDETGLPVGGLLASNGTIALMNYDGSFSESSSASLISKYLKPNVKFNFYEIIEKVPLSASANILYDKYVPIKTFYAEEFPTSYGGKDLNIPLRDFFFRLETVDAPTIFLPNISLTGAISMLLDNIGFSNYSFSNIENKYDPRLPYFFVEPDVSVGEVLNRLAIATQTAMFFDEYNNLVVMFKERLLPENPISTFTLNGSKSIANGVIELPNIIDVYANESKILNDGNIVYTSRYIQRASEKLQDELFLSQDKIFKYKPVLLWEATGDNMIRDMNEVINQSEFVLSAVPLASDLINQPPSVVNGQIINNFMDVGENAYWLSRPKGLLYSNGEIIKYDGIEYAISSSVATNLANVIINSSEEYQDYVAKLPFAGKIYPTGRIRIYAEPYYDEVFVNSASPQIVFRSGPVKSHGRGQFNTPIAYHSAGLPSYWTNNAHIKSFKTESSKIFETTPTEDIRYPNITFLDPKSKSASVAVGQFVTLDIAAQNCKRTGAIKNFLRKINFSDSEELISPQTKTPVPGAIQSSALVFTGPTPMPSDFSKRDVMTYIYKDFGVFSAPRDTTVGSLIVQYENGINPSASTSGGFLLGSQFVTVFPRSNLILKQEMGFNMWTVNTGEISISLAESICQQLSFSPEIKSAEPNKKVYIDTNFPEPRIGKILDEKPNTEPNTRISNGIMTHVGTRMRIIGIPKTNNSLQSVKNSTTYFSVQTNNNDEKTNIDGGSGGIGICVNSEKNYGYFLEVCALTEDQLENFTDYNRTTGKANKVIHNLIFYKVVPDSTGKAIPVKLWGGLANILVDEGKFVGTDNAIDMENPTVYDLALEYTDNGNSKTFYIWLNNTNVATVEDRGDKGAPVLPATNKGCMFVRGSSQAMFEYFYALNKAYARESRFPLLNDISKVFGPEEIDSESLRQYAVSGLIRSTYLSGISTQTNPKFNLYFEEFGTIMREAHYFNVRYDQAYPALLSYLAPTINKERAYTVSGFYGGSYGAEFLIFNSTDRAIVLDDSSGNFLRILGVTFTQNTTRTLTVDDFLNESTDFTDIIEAQSAAISSPLVIEKILNGVKNSRFKYGKRDFTIESPYIQTVDMAENVMAWMINRTLRQRKIIVFSTFGTSVLQLGDIVNINYTMPDGIDFVDSDKKFVVAGINHSRTMDNISTNIKLVEV